MAKRTQPSPSKDEPTHKKTQKGSEAEVPSRGLESIPSSIEKQEEEEELASPLRSRGLRSRGPSVLMEVKPARESAAAEGAMVAELPATEVIERAKVDIPIQPGVLTQPKVPPA